MNGRACILLARFLERPFGTLFLVTSFSKAHPFGHQLGVLLPAVFRRMIRSSSMATGVCPSVALNSVASLFTRSRASMTILDSMLLRVSFARSLVNRLIFASYFSSGISGKVRSAASATLVALIPPPALL